MWSTARWIVRGAANGGWLGVPRKNSFHLRLAQLRSFYSAFGAHQQDPVIVVLLLPLILFSLFFLIIYSL